MLHRSSECEATSEGQTPGGPQLARWNQVGGWKGQRAQQMLRALSAHGGQGMHLQMETQRPRSHGTGRFVPSDFGALGTGCVLEEGVLVFHPDRVFLGDNVYVGHQAMLKGYYKNELRIGDGSWIGQQCFLHAAGGIHIGRNVGMGPGVRILTSMHGEAGRDVPILHSPIEFRPVFIDDNADLGVGSIVLPGVRIGRGAQVGAGAVVTRDVPDFAVAVGNPARVQRMRPETHGR